MFNIIKKFRIMYYYVKTKVLKFSHRDDLLQWQMNQFSGFKKHVLVKSIFYKQYLNKPLEQWPIVDKKTYMENFNNINTQGLDRDIALDIAIQSEKNRDFDPKYNNFTVGLSSGTSGNRGLFVASESEQAEWAGTILAKMLPKGFKKHKIAFFLRANNNLYEAVGSKYVKFQFFDLIKPLEELLDDLESFQPTILIAPAQVLKQIASYQNKSINISPIKIISVAEVLDDDDRSFIENTFNKKLHEVYQCTEGFLAYTCEKGKLHLNEDIAIFEKEWLDKKTGRFTPIITDFRRKTQPIIRYRLDDVLIESKKGCDCGSPYTVLSSIIY